MEVKQILHWRHFNLFPRKPVPIICTASISQQQIRRPTWIEITPAEKQLKVACHKDLLHFTMIGNSMWIIRHCLLPHLVTTLARSQLEMKVSHFSLYTREFMLHCMRLPLLPNIHGLNLTTFLSLIEKSRAYLFKVKEEIQLWECFSCLITRTAQGFCSTDLTEAGRCQNNRNQKGK